MNTLKARLAASKKDEGGFTLIELLIVIVILGVLSAIVVFSVNGISDKGNTAATKTDENTIRVAEEANYAQNGAYANEDVLVNNGFLSAASTLHDVCAVTVAGKATYVVKAQGAGC